MAEETTQDNQQKFCWTENIILRKVSQNGKIIGKKKIFMPTGQKVLAKHTL